MVSFIITSINDKGEEAIKQHLEEKKTLSKKDRLTYELAFEEQLLSVKPLTLLIKKMVVAQALNDYDLLTIFHKTMLNNGAKKKDYNIRVVY